MNLYLLLEGKRSEAKIYPAWLASFEPAFTRVLRVDEISREVNRRFYSFSANGYPSIIGEHLSNAVADVRKYPGYDWLLVCLDIDESSASERIALVEDAARVAGLEETSTRLMVVAQNRCIETWLLGSQRLIGAAPPSYLAELRDFYDVRRACPELMGYPRSWNNHANFHFHYLREAFKARRMRYSKRDPGDAATTSYFESLRQRLKNDVGVLPSLRKFVEFIDSL